MRFVCPRRQIEHPDCLISCAASFLHYYTRRVMTNCEVPTKTVMKGTVCSRGVKPPTRLTCFPPALHHLDAGHKTPTYVSRSSAERTNAMHHTLSILSRCIVSVGVVPPSKSISPSILMPRLLLSNNDATSPSIEQSPSVFRCRA